MFTCGERGETIGRMYSRMATSHAARLKIKNSPRFSSVNSSMEWLLDDDIVTTVRM